MKIATVLALLPILAKGQGNTNTSSTATTETTTTFPVCPEHGEPKWFQPATSTSSDFNVPALLISAGAMAPDGKMWVYGGKDDLDTASRVEWFNHLYFLDTKAHAWHLVAPHEENVRARDGASMVIVDGNPWIFGGRTAPASAGGEILDSVLVYDVQRKEFFSGTHDWEIALTAYHHTAVQKDGKMWVFGGIMDQHPWRGDLLLPNNVYYLDTTATTKGGDFEFSWVEISGSGDDDPYVGDKPRSRFGHTAAIGPDGRMWVFGGHLADARLSQGLHAFNLETHIWTRVDRTLPGGAYLFPKYMHSAAFLDCKMWIFGGFTEGTVDDEGGIRKTLLSFDIQTETWANVALTGGPGNLSQHLGVMGSNGMWIYGGYGIGGAKSDAYFLEFISTTTTTTTASTTTMTTNTMTSITETSLTKTTSTQTTRTMTTATSTSSITTSTGEDEELNSAHTECVANLLVFLVGMVSCFWTRCKICTLTPNCWSSVSRNSLVPKVAKMAQQKNGQSLRLQSLRLCDDAPLEKNSSAAHRQGFLEMIFLVTQRDLSILIDFAKWEQVSFKSQIISMVFVCLCFFRWTATFAPWESIRQWNPAVFGPPPKVHQQSTRPWRMGWIRASQQEGGFFLLEEKVGFPTQLVPFDLQNWTRAWKNDVMISLHDLWSFTMH